MRLESTKDYDNYIARLRAFPRYMDEHIVRMREGLKAGIAVAQVALAGADTAVGPLMPANPSASPLYAPFRLIRATVPAQERYEARVVRPGGDRRGRDTLVREVPRVPHA